MEREREKYVTTEKAIDLLKKDDIIVNAEQAELILIFLRNIADIVVDTYLGIDSE